MQTSNLQIEQIFSLGEKEKLVINAHAIKHMIAHSDVTIEALKIALQRFGTITLNADKKDFKIVDLSDTDFSGESLCVPRSSKVKLDEEILFAYMVGRELPIPVVHGNPIIARKLAVGVIYDSKDSYTLNTAYWCTGLSAKGAWSKFLDQEEFDGGMEFWLSNTLITLQTDTLVESSFKQMLEKHTVQNPDFLKSYLEKHKN